MKDILTLLGLNKKQEPNPKRQRDGLVRNIAPKAISRVRKDMQSWKSALHAADSVERPRRRYLMDLYADILLDATLSSQIEQRIARSLSADFTLKDKNDKINEEATKALAEAVWFPLLQRYMVESVFYGHSVVELSPEGDSLSVELIPRQNIIPELGVCLFDSTAEEGVDYRNMREYGTYILEFGAPKNYGLLNKAVPYALFKKFALSCWSELCEIYGIPPRFLKTNTQDPDMLNRAEMMLRDMGAAAYFVIDTEEEFQFAKGVDTDGSLYDNLILRCNAEMSVLISGAQIGQDTKNGNRSKEETSMKQLLKLVESDKKLISDWMNSTVLPALVKLGIVPDGLRYSFNKEEDPKQLWERTAATMQYYDVDPEWIKDTFGIPVTARRNQPQQNNLGFFE